ncbi:MAG: hypothetical protein FWH01_10810, partial [Oscillospiraceae bacterium]|nr:hypothetical protein [Oscillospiraceae bacterium]
MGKWLLIDRAPGGAPTIAKKRLVSALEQWGADLETRSTWTGAFTGNTVIIGLNTDPIIYNLVDEVATAPESLQMFRAGGAGSAGRASGVGNVGSARDVGGASDVGGAAVLSGSDARGLAYAVMEMAERVVERGEAALLELEPETKAPSVAVRGIDKLICNTGDCDWWMSEDYWRYRLEGMLRARFNRLTFLVGFDTSYLSPPYPYFVDVPEFPGVRVEDPGVDRAQYRAALRRLGSLAHEYGMDFTFATWQQTNWLSSQKSKVVGIEDLMLYCSAGIRELALQCPEIDTIQLRVNHEAGVGTQVTA